MSDSRFIPENFDDMLACVIEECGEVLEYLPSIESNAALLQAFGRALQAAGKTQRFGWDGFNPLLPEKERELNIDWLLRELGALGAQLDPISAQTASSDFLGEMRDLRDAIGRFENLCAGGYRPASIGGEKLRKRGFDV